MKDETFSEFATTQELSHNFLLAVKDKTVLSYHDLDQLWSLAEKATEGGNKNAFFELCHFFKSKMLLEEACEAYFISLIYLSEADDVTSLEEKLQEFFEPISGIAQQLQDFALESSQAKEDSPTHLTRWQSNGYMTRFMAWWETAEDQISLEDVLKPYYDVKNTWSLLTSAAENSNSEMLLIVWKKLRYQITPEYLHKRPTKNIFWGPLSATILGLLSKLRSREYYIIFDDILQQLPHILETNYVSKICKEKARSVIDGLQFRSDWDTKLQPLIIARNAFFSELDQAKGDPQYKSLEKLKKLAKKALERGYFNAYYDLGLYLEDRGLQEEACEAFELIPPSSWHYHAMNEWVAVNLYSQALLIEDTEQRKTLLSKALQCALKINKEKRGSVVQKIAYSYFFHESNVTFQPGDVDPLPAALIAVLDENLPVAFWLDRFAKIKELTGIRAQVKVLDKELDEIFFSVLDSQQLTLSNDKNVKKSVERNLQEEAWDANAQLPKQSIDHAKINQEVVAKLLAQAFQADTRATKRELLIKAIPFALRCSEEQRAYYIKRIASQYITADQHTKLKPEDIDALIEKIIPDLNEMVSIPPLVYVFQEIAEELTLMHSIRLLEKLQLHSSEHADLCVGSGSDEPIERQVYREEELIWQYPIQKMKQASTARGNASPYKDAKDQGKSKYRNSIR